MTLENDETNGTRSPSGKFAAMRSNVQVPKDACNVHGNTYKQTTNVVIDKGLLVRVIKFYAM